MILRRSARGRGLRTLAGWPDAARSPECDSSGSPRPWEPCGLASRHGATSSCFLPTPPQRRPPALATLTLGSGTELRSELS